MIANARHTTSPILLPPQRSGRHPGRPFPVPAPAGNLRRPATRRPPATTGKEHVDVRFEDLRFVRRPGTVVTVIALMMAAGIGLLVLVAVAIVVGVVDAALAPRWRDLAIERRERWESRRPEFHGIDGYDVDDRDED